MQEQISESRPTPRKERKNITPAHIHSAHVMPAFTHPPKTSPVDWVFLREFVRQEHHA